MPTQSPEKTISLSEKLKKSLLIIIIHSLLPILALLFYINLGKREILIEQTKKDFLTYTKLTAIDLKEKINNVKEILTTLDGLKVFTKGNQEYCTKATQSLKGLYPTLSVIGAVDINGKVFCLSDPINLKVNIADRLYFTETKITMAFSSGEFLIGKINNTPGISFGYPLLDSKGKFRGVAFSGFTLEYLNSIVSNYNLPSGYNITLIDKNGVILARFPNPDDLPGKNDSGDPAIKIISADTNEGSFILKDNPSGHEKIYAYTRIDSTLSVGAIYLYLDAPTDFIRAEASKRLISDIVVTVTFVILAVSILITDWFFFIHKKVGEIETKKVHDNH